MHDVDLVLTIRHYKLLKLFSQNLRSRTAAQGGEATYHARTSQNIARIFGGDADEKIRSLLALPSRPLSDGYLHRISPRSFKHAEVGQVE